MPDIPPKPTLEQEMLLKFLQWKGVHTHEDAEQVLIGRFGRPDWVPVFDEILQVVAPWEYAEDESPNVHHPEWDHLRSTPWDAKYKESFVAATGRPPEEWTRREP